MISPKKKSPKAMRVEKLMVNKLWKDMSQFERRRVIIHLVHLKNAPTKESL